MLRRKMHTEVIVLQQVEVAHLLSHGDLLHSALVQVELLSHVNITAQNTAHCHHIDSLASSCFFCEEVLVSSFFLLF